MEKLLVIFASIACLTKMHLHCLKSLFIAIKCQSVVGLASIHKLCYYITVVRPVLEYACRVWHSSLTAEQTKTFESLQQRAMKII